MHEGAGMASLDEQILRTAKEVIVKFIEAGRISPSGFGEMFETVYHTVENTVKGQSKPEEQKEVKSD